MSIVIHSVRRCGEAVTGGQGSLLILLMIILCYSFNDAVLT